MKKLIINGKEVKGKYFAYDGCHKIFILENENQVISARGLRYEIYHIKEIEEIWGISCPLRFINSYDLQETYVKQFEDSEPLFSWKEAEVDYKEVYNKLIKRLRDTYDFVNKDYYGCLEDFEDGVISIEVLIESEARVDMMEDILNLINDFEEENNVK